MNLRIHTGLRPSGKSVRLVPHGWTLVQGFDDVRALREAQLGDVCPIEAPDAKKFLLPVENKWTAEGKTGTVFEGTADGQLGRGFYQVFQINHVAASVYGYRDTWQSKGVPTIVQLCGPGTYAICYAYRVTLTPEQLEFYRSKFKDYTYLAV